MAAVQGPVQAQSAESAPLLELDRVTFAYPGKPPVLENASARLDQARFHVLTGPSGAGKSTVLRLLCRLEEPDSGTIRLAGQDLRLLPPPVLRRRVMYIQQTPTLVEGSVRANLILPFGFAANADLVRPGDDLLRSMLDDFLLTGLSLDQTARALSVGQRQRLCLIRGLLLSPLAMLLDEPTSALDPESSRVVVDAARRLPTERGVAVVMISHGPELDAVNNARRLAVRNRTLEEA